MPGWSGLLLGRLLGAEPAELRFALARDPRLAKLKGYAAEQVWAAIVQRRAGTAVTAIRAATAAPR